MHPVEKNGNLAIIRTILNIIGSPFNSPQIPSSDYNDRAIEHYGIACNNKIGLLFLESIAKEMRLIAELQVELDRERQKNVILQVTSERAAAILNKAQIKYAVVKSNYPFAAVPNDVDLVILEEARKYRKAIQFMRANKFEVVGGDEAPLEICLHDSTRAKHYDDPNKKFASKDPFDVDIYREIGASHIVYMDKSKLLNYVCQTTINGTTINIFKPVVEIALEIFHSIYPERLYTLLLHLHILYVIKELTSDDIDEFLNVCRDQSFGNAVLSVLSLTETIEELCFGNSPSKVTDIREAFGKKKPTKIKKIPHLYPLSMVSNCFWGKRSDLVFIASLIRQIVSMANPRYARYLLGVYRDRANRDTY